jgi:hypothetical protein
MEKNDGVILEEVDWEVEVQNKDEDDFWIFFSLKPSNFIT